MAASTFADTDYLIPGYILGKIGQLGSGSTYYSNPRFCIYCNCNKYYS